jgi:single-strand DNA-binding protein
MINKWIGIGRIGKNPETREVGSSSVTSFSIACSESWKDKDGNKQERTEWVNCQAWGGLGNIIQQYATKGTLLYVEGRLETRKYQDSNGVDKYSTSVNVKEMKLLSSKSDQSQGQSHEQSYQEDTGSHRAQDPSNNVPF